MALSPSTRNVAALALAGAAGALLLQRRRRRFDFEGASVLITGGSRGLGLEMARLFADEGAHLALLARTPEDLQEAKAQIERRGGQAIAVPCDVRDRGQVARAVQTVLERYGRIDVLVNDAGVIQAGPFENQSLKDFEEAMAVHTWGSLHLIREIWPGMRDQGGGRIVNIASIGGLVAIPHLLPYSASKFALVGLSDGLRAELARYNIRVTTVAPGLMRTGSHVNALMKGQHRKEFTWFALMDALPLFSVSATRAARQIVEACRRGAPQLVISPQARFLHLANALFPATVALAMKATVRLLPGPVPEGHRHRRGKESTSPLAPSPLTRMADRAAVRNREV